VSRPSLRSPTSLTLTAVRPRSIYDLSDFQAYVMRLERFAYDFGLQRVRGEFDQFWAEYANGDEMSEVNQ